MSPAPLMEALYVWANLTSALSKTLGRGDGGQIPTSRPPLVDDWSSTLPARVILCKGQQLSGERQRVDETPDGLELVDEIAALGGIDSLVIGTNDLTTEMGPPGDYESPGH